MAYQHDPDGPVVDEGGFRARYIAKVAVYVVILVVLGFFIRLLFTKEDRLDTVKDLIRLELQYSPYNYTYDYSDDVLVVTLWSTDYALTAKKASTGDSEAQENWQKIKENFSKYAVAIHNTMILKDFPDVDVTVKLVNEINRDRNLLIYHAGEIVYEVT